MKRDFRLARLSETTYRIWHARNSGPGEGWIVNLSGACSCLTRNCKVLRKCKHYALLMDHLVPPGLMVDEARKLAQETLAALAEDEMIRRFKMRKPKLRNGMVTHLIVDIKHRGRGTPMSLEGRVRGVNILMVIQFDINQKSKPVYLAMLRAESIPVWEPLDV